MIGELSIQPGSKNCVCHWPELCDGTGWIECQDECECQCGGMRECPGCHCCRPSTLLKAPFPWFGGKSRVAHLVWDRFGDCDNYVEPFAGSLAVLLGRPHPPQTETVNDIDCYLSNFWRALQYAPEEVAKYADWPVNEADKHARHLWLCSREEFRERMKVDPDYYDAKIAGWWVWGQCIWIGSGWCSRRLPHLAGGKGISRQLLHLGSAGTGINRQLPHLGDAGRGVHRQLPQLRNAGEGINRDLSNHKNLLHYFQTLAVRLRQVRVCCGDWTRVMGPSVTFKHGITGIFLDPPYSGTNRSTVYSDDDLTIAHDVRTWAIENAGNPDLRIALCGYEGEHLMPSAWEAIHWKANGGYGNLGQSQGRENASREMIWFSPHCLRPQESLFYPASQPDEWLYPEEQD